MSMGSALLGDAYVDIMAETGKLERAIQQAEGMAKSAVSNIGATLAIGIGAAMSTAVGAGIAAVWAWAGEEQSVKDLESSIHLLGGSLEELMPRYEKVAAQIQQNTTIADDATRKAMAYAASMGAPVDKLDQLAIAAAGISARLGMAMQTSMMLLGRALKTGQFTLFTRYGLVIDRTATKQEQFNQVLEFGRQGFAKGAEMAETFTGRLTQLKNNVGDIMEELGKNIVERLKLTEAINEIQRFAYKLAQVVQGIFSDIDWGASFNLNAIIPALEKAASKIMAGVATIPEVGRQLGNAFNKLFSEDKWKNIVSIFKTIFVESVKLFLTTLAEGLKALSGVFEGLGAIIIGAIEAGLIKMDIPIISKKLQEKAKMELAQEKWGVGKTLYGDLERRKEDQQKILDSIQEWEITEYIIGKGKDRIQTGLYQVVNSSSEFIETISKQFNESIDKSISAIKEGGLDPRQETNEIKKVWEEHYKELLKRFKRASETESMPDMGEADFEVGGGEEKGEGSFISGIADFWRTMQTSQRREEEIDLAKRQVAEQQNSNKFLEKIATYVGGSLPGTQGTLIPLSGA